MVHPIVKRWRNGTERVEHKCEMCDTTSTNHVSILPKRIVRYKSLYRGPHPIPQSVHELFVCCANGILYYNLPPTKKGQTRSHKQDCCRCMVVVVVFRAAFLPLLPWNVNIQPHRCNRNRNYKRQHREELVSPLLLPVGSWFHEPNQQERNTGRQKGTRKNKTRDGKWWRETRRRSIGCKLGRR